MRLISQTKTVYIFSAPDDETNTHFVSLRRNAQLDLASFRAGFFHLLPLVAQVVLFCCFFNTFSTFLNFTAMNINPSLKATKHGRESSNQNPTLE